MFWNIVQNFVHPRETTAFIYLREHADFVEQYTFTALHEVLKNNFSCFMTFIIH